MQTGRCFCRCADFGADLEHRFRTVRSLMITAILLKRAPLGSFATRL